MDTARALLLTDVVDSTELSHAVGDAESARLWAAHDRAARDLLLTWRGREIDKSDGLLAVFESAADAAGYALAYHRAMEALALPFKARAGLHVGPVTLRENSAADVARGAKQVEVDGHAKLVAARAMAAARGGQTLITGDARLAIGATTLRLQSHGHWRLKGLPEPVHLFEIGDEQSPFTPPPDDAKAYRVVRQGELWQPLREIKHSVPAERDTFVGRQEPLLELARKLEAGARLVSVLGMGGTGKTRLVTRFAWSWLGEYPGGVWFCDLTQARSLDGIHAAVAHGLDVPLGKTEPVVQLARAIAGRGKCLLILDNFEQVTRHAEETLGHWLDRAPQAQFIVTTREVLGIAGEQTLALAPLPAADAAALFMRRAEAARSTFRASADDDTAIAQLVKMLDGLPLAIELAAARVRVMPPRKLLARMNERFKLLWSTTGRRDHHATLRAAFDWSWELLTLPEKAGLAQLSVFEGGFTLESTEAVLDLSALPDAPWSIDVVNGLVDKSFVRPVGDGRFDLLESVRVYALEHLQTEGRYEGSGPAAWAEAERRHGAFFQTLGPRRAVENRCAELDNLVAACRRAVQRGDGEVAVQALDGAWGALKLRGPFRVASELAELVRTVPALSPVSTMILDFIGGCACMASGQMAHASSQLEEAVRSAEASGDPTSRVRTQGCLAELRVYEGRIEDARQCYQRSLAGARELDNPALQCDALSGLGGCHAHLGEVAQAQVYFEAVLALALAAKDRRWEGGASANLGHLHATLGQLDQAHGLYEQSILIAHELGDRRWEGDVRCNLGLLHHSEGRTDDAQRELERALSLARELGYSRLESVVLCNLGIVQTGMEKHDAARLNYGLALQIARDLRDLRSEGQFLGYLAVLNARQGRHAEAQECVRTGAELLRSVSDQVSLGVLICGAVEVAFRNEGFDAATIAFSTAEELARACGAEERSELGMALLHAKALLDASAPSHPIAT